MKRISICLLVAVALIVNARRGAAQGIVLHIPTIGGESTVTSHVGDIDVTNFTWSVSITVASTQGASAPNFTDVTIVKSIDKSSPTLALKCAQAANLGTVTLYCTRLANNGQYDFYKIVLSNTIVTSDQVTSSPGVTVPGESITLHFTNIQWTYVPLNSGSPGTPVTTQFP